MDSTLVWVLVGLAAFIVVAIASAAYREHYGIGEAKVVFTREDTGTTVHVGHGSSLGEAVADGTKKLYDDLSSSSRYETIHVRYRAMVKTLAENRDRMFQDDIAKCEYYIRQTKSMLDGREAEQAKIPENRRFVAQQRRLMTDSLRYDVMQRDGFRCQLCGATAADGYKLHVDHIIPVSKGGKTEMRNLRTLCERCNMGKGAKIETPSELTPEEFARHIAK